MVTDDERALVLGELAALRAQRERERASEAAIQALDARFHQSTTVAEAIERGTTAYFAAVHRAPAALRPRFCAVHVDALRAMVREGSLSSGDAAVLLGFDLSNDDRALSFVDPSSPPEVASITDALRAGAPDTVAQVFAQLLTERPREEEEEEEEEEPLRFDRREIAAAQLCRSGQHALALAGLDAIVRNPLVAQSSWGPCAQPISRLLLDTLAEHLTPEALASCARAAFATLDDRAATAGERLALATLLRGEPARAQDARALSDFAARPCVLSGADITRERRAQWIPVISSHIEAWVDMFDRGSRYASDAVCERLRWVDDRDPDMVRALWPGIARMRDAVERSTSTGAAWSMDAWIQRAGLFGSELARSRRPRAVTAARWHLYSLPDRHMSSEAAQRRWVDRVLREAPHAVTVLSFSAPSAAQLLALDAARLESGRESLWTLLAGFYQLASWQYRAAALDRWYRDRCPIEGDGWFGHAPLSALLARSRDEGPVARRTRWQWSRDEMIDWLARIDPLQDDSRIVEPGLSVLIGALEGNNRGRAQLDRLLNARLSALSAQIESGDEGIESGADVLSLLPFASIETLRRYAALEEREATLLRSAVDSKARGLAVVNALRVSHEFAREFVARLAGWDDDLSSAEAIIAVVHDCTRTIAEALKLIETFASDVRALSNDWRAAYERWLSPSAQRALSRWRELSERTRASLRAMIAESAVDERSKRWALDDDAQLLGDLAMLAPRAAHAPIEWLAVLHRLGGTAVIDAIGDQLVDGIIAEARGERRRG